MKTNDPIYQLKGEISVRKAVPFGLQHVLAMFVANIAPILIVAGAVKMSPEESGALVQSAMIVAGLGSLLQMFPLWRLGSGLPIIMGISFTFVSVACVIGTKYGYGAVLGAALIGGVLDFGVTVEDGAANVICDEEFTPIVTHYDGNFSNVRLYKLSDYTPEMALSHGVRANSRFDYDYITEYLTGKGLYNLNDQRYIF